MKLLNPHLPELTLREACRFWLPPEVVLEVALIWEYPEARKFFSNVTSQGLIPFRRSGTARTNPKLYNLHGALMIRVMWDMTRRGRSYEYSRVAAVEVANSLGAAITGFKTYYDFVDAGPWRLLLVRQGPAITSISAKTLPAEEFTLASVSDFAWPMCEVMPIHGMIQKAINQYADRWAEINEQGRQSRPHQDDDRQPNPNAAMRPIPSMEPAVTPDRRDDGLSLDGDTP